MNRIPIISFIALQAMTLVTASSAETSKPNIIVIMADDMGYGDAGFTGSKEIKTPNLDALAASGVTFTSGYANTARNLLLAGGP